MALSCPKLLVEILKRWRCLDGNDFRPCLLIWSFTDLRLFDGRPGIPSGTKRRVIRPRFSQSLSSIMCKLQVPPPRKTPLLNETPPTISQLHTWNQNNRFSASDSALSGLLSSINVDSRGSVTNFLLSLYLGSGAGQVHTHRNQKHFKKKEIENRYQAL